MGQKPQQVGGFTSPHQWTKTDPAWIPELDDRMVARYEKLKTELKVEKRAFDDAAANSPQPDDADLNATQMQIRDHAVNKVSMLFAFLSEQLGLAVQNLAGEGDKLNFAEEAKKAETDFDNALSENPALKDASDKLVKAETALKYFAARNKRMKPADYHSTPLLFWATLFGLLVVESIANGVILQDISPGGFSGGIMLAMMISAVNVVSGVIGGAVGWRLLGHVNWFAKIIGIVFTVATLVGAVFWNFLVAHYRQLAEESVHSTATDTSIFDPFAAIGAPAAEGAAGPVSETNLFGSALSHMQVNGWFALDSIWAWGLLGVGFIIFLIACKEGWEDLADPYWGYRKVDVKKQRANKEFEEECEHAIASASLKLDDAVARCGKSVDAVEAKCSKSVAIADLAEQRTVEVLNSEAHWVAECNQLLRFYRESNDRVRHETLPPPAYWSRYPTPEDYRQFLAQGSGGSLNIELANKQLDEVRSRRKALDALVEHNRRSRAELDESVRALKASIADRGKTLQEEVKRDARARMKEFLVAGSKHTDPDFTDHDTAPAGASA